LRFICQDLLMDITENKCGEFTDKRQALAFGWFEGAVGIIKLSRPQKEGGKAIGFEQLEQSLSYNGCQASIEGQRP
jgi:hypothetical protein